MALRVVTLSAALATAGAVCPSPQWLLYRDQCYWASPFPLEWRSVASVCELQAPGSRHVSVHDLQVAAFVAEQVLNGTGGWLGLRRPNESAGWQWSDGTPYDWHDWAAGQPRGDGERCAYLQRGGTDGWRDGDCIVSYLRFVCQTEDQLVTTTEPPETTQPYSTTAQATENSVTVS
ncbi:Collectin-12 [Amphibalanus amphitrite]|uniref:Collectin-12 n=1 Tax=Amphibalanus amphitrite TaxID=1232801 RepID=A0A6A4WG88_AMPAM|nr:Collectin-12 [Amphibalanus amphitrite]